ncbi:unnamed protein product [Amoebophrya sp. A120]|nr:unnamed protein product [Amoebophrya sp. A120]|eukprot:GSA120T00012874001.1
MRRHEDLLELQTKKLKKQKSIAEWLRLYALAGRASNVPTSTFGSVVSGGVGAHGSSLASGPLAKHIGSQGARLQPTESVLWCVLGKMTNLPPKQVRDVVADCSATHAVNRLTLADYFGVWSSDCSAVQVVDAKAASCAGHLKSILLGMPLHEYNSKTARDALLGYNRNMIEAVQESFSKRGWVTQYKRSGVAAARAKEMQQQASTGAGAGVPQAPRSSSVLVQPAAPDLGDRPKWMLSHRSRLTLFGKRSDLLRFSAHFRFARDDFEASGTVDHFEGSLSGEYMECVAQVLLSEQSAIVQRLAKRGSPGVVGSSSASASGSEGGNASKSSGEQQEEIKVAQLPKAAGKAAKAASKKMKKKDAASASAVAKAAAPTASAVSSKQAYAQPELLDVDYWEKEKVKELIEELETYSSSDDETGLYEDEESSSEGEDNHEQVPSTTTAAGNIKKPRKGSDGSIAAGTIAPRDVGEDGADDSDDQDDGSSTSSEDGSSDEEESGNSDSSDVEGERNPQGKKKDAEDNETGGSSDSDNENSASSEDESEQENEDEDFQSSADDDDFSAEEDLEKEQFAAGNKNKSGAGHQLQSNENKLPGGKKMSRIKKIGKGVSLHLQTTKDFPQLVQLDYHDKNFTTKFDLDASDSLWLQHEESFCHQILKDEEAQTGRPVFDAVARMRRVLPTSKIHDALDPYNAPLDFVQRVARSRFASSSGAAMKRLQAASSEESSPASEQQVDEEGPAGKRRKVEQQTRQAAVSSSSVISSVVADEDEKYDAIDEVKLSETNESVLAKRLVQLVKAREAQVKMDFSDDKLLEDLEKLRLIVCFFPGTLVADSSYLFAVPAHLAKKYCQQRTIPSGLGSGGGAAGSKLLQEDQVLVQQQQATVAPQSGLQRNKPKLQFVPDVKGRFARLYGAPAINEKFLRDLATKVLQKCSKNKFIQETNLNLEILPFTYIPPSAWTKVDGSLNLHLLNVLQVRVWNLLSKCPGMSADNLAQQLPFFDVAEMRMLLTDFLDGVVDCNASGCYFPKPLRDLRMHFY